MHSLQKRKKKEQKAEGCQRMLIVNLLPYGLLIDGVNWEFQKIMEQYTLQKVQKILIVILIQTKIKTVEIMYIDLKFKGFN